MEKLDKILLCIGVIGATLFITGIVWYLAPSEYDFFTPAPPLENVSDNVKEIDMTIDIAGRLRSGDERTLGLSLSFRDKGGRSFLKLDDGHPCIKIEPSSNGHLIGYFQEEEEEIFNESYFDALEGYGIFEDYTVYLPHSYRNGVNVTITLPNGKNHRSSIDYSYSGMGDAWYYANGYKLGEEDARMGYSPDIPWDSYEYYRDGYTDGYMGATPRYIYSPIRKTITIE